MGIHTRSERAPALLDRRRERGALDNLLGDLRSGRGRALVVRGEAGVGKSALLEYVVAAAPDMRVARAAGVASEMELAFASLHQLCAPLLDRLERLPAPQQDALAVAFGLREGDAPDRFLVALAVLTLLSEVAEERPLLCVVDDAQWLDRSSAQVLAFAARRLLAEPAGLIFATREPGKQLRALPELEVPGLRDEDARALLHSVVRWPLDGQVRERILAETNGNPLALLELPRGLSPTQLAGGFGIPDELSLPGRIQESFLRRVEGLPEAAWLMLLLAAAEPVGDPTLVRRAATQLELPPDAVASAEAEGLLKIGGRVVFRHPLVRSAIYGASSPSDRRKVHGALAVATDPDLDADRRAWHRAQAAVGPDEEVADELERSAARAQGRGGPAAAAAFLERAAELSLDAESPGPPRSGRRAGHVPRGSSRRFPGAAVDRRGGAARRARASRGGHDPGPDRLLNQSWQRWAGAAAPCRPAARAARPAHGQGYLSRRHACRPFRGPPRPRLPSRSGAGGAARPPCRRAPHSLRAPA